MNPSPAGRYLLWGLLGVLAVAALIAILPLVLFSGPFALAVKITIFTGAAVVRAVSSADR